MMDFFASLPGYIQTLILTLITYFMTMLGAGVVFFFKTINQTVINIMLSLSAGVMLASAFFSLLIPAIEQSKLLFSNNFIVPTIGFFVGGIFVVVADKFLDKISNKVLIKNNVEKNSDSIKRKLLMVSAITLHNILEGICVGVAVASASFGLDGGIGSAIMLAIGIALQNFPEGASVSLPLRSEGCSRKKAFFIGQISGIVEPIFAIIAFFCAQFVSSLLPFLLAFSSGAMISVACTELISESAKYNKNLTIIFVLIGFCIMMVLNLAL